MATVGSVKRRIATLCGSFLISVTLIAGYLTVVTGDPEDHLVGYWSFNEGSGGIAYDSTSNGNDGTIYGSPAWITGPPGSGHALEFDGQDDFVDMGGVPSGDLDVTGDITLSCMFKTDTPQQGTLVNKLDNSSNQSLKDNGYWLGLSTIEWNQGADTLSFRLAYRSQNLDDYDNHTTTEGFADDEWHCVAAVYTPDSSSRPRIYVDGTEQPGAYYGTALAAIGESLEEHSFRIGAYSPGPPVDPGDKFDGSIDEVRVYSKALSEQEIRAICFPEVPASSRGHVALLCGVLALALGFFALRQAMRA